MARIKVQTRPKQPKPVRVRGYYLREQREGDFWLGKKRWLGWYPEGELPSAWEATKRDPEVIQAVLIRSGKPFITYHRPS